jgi:sigma-E factor negative regulatory protein RseC
MLRTGRVVQAEGETLKVCFSRMDACESCGMCDAGRQETVVKLQGKARIGDIVEVEMPDARVLKTSIITYVIPLAMLIAGLWIGSVLWREQEFCVVLSGIAGLLLGYFCLKKIDRHLGQQKAWQPRIISVTSAEVAKSDESSV